MSEEKSEKDMFLVGKKKKPKRAEQKGSTGWEFFMILLLFTGIFLLSSGLYTAWTTFHDADLIEPFVCIYEESDMHAREVAAAFENIMSRAEQFQGERDESFFSGNVNYGYCVKNKEEYGGMVYDNISGTKSAVFDVNIRSLIDMKEPYKEEQEVSVNGEDYDAIYYDCYWWDVDSDTDVIYKGYSDSRVQVPESFQKVKKVSKIGICYSGEVLNEKQQNWQVYVQFMYLMTILLITGGIITCYAVVQLLCYGGLPQFLKKCFLEAPFMLIISGLAALYSCYERKISLFASQNHMEMLTTSAGTVQLVVDILAGAFILTVCFMVLFLGIHILVVKLKRPASENTLLFGTLYEKYEGAWKKEVRIKEFSGKILRSIRFTMIKMLRAWRFFWGLFTGKSVKGNSIAERERRRILFAAIVMAVCILGIVAGYCLYQKTSGYYFTGVREFFQNGTCMYFFIILLVTFMVVYLFGNMLNTVDYAKMEQMIEKVSQGNYQEVSIKKMGISKRSVCFSDAEKLEQIGSGFQEAVEDQIHAERMKMELLTNVSHDLKTPLTSIISYIELLNMEEGLSAEAEDYIMILKKKAERLKTIISEVFELAKTTSGEIKIEKKEIDFYRLVVQTMGDMQDRIDASGMKIKENLAQKNVMIYSDGERMYRVLQNLLDNALKYSLKGTRVYMDLVSEQGVLTFTIKNVAGYEMEFEAGDITERFVRGDKNRTTEGSGLGLSIAQGFTIACGGEFAVIVDGDMFKAEIKFPVIESAEKKES